jgi:hypothetical protein
MKQETYYTIDDPPKSHWYVDTHAACIVIDVLMSTQVAERVSQASATLLFTAGFVEKITCRLAAHPGENEAPT